MAWSATRYQGLKLLSLWISGLSVVMFLLSLKYQFGFAGKFGMIGCWTGGLLMAFFPNTRSEGWFWNARIYDFRWIPTIHLEKGNTVVWIPFWILTLVAITAAWFFHRKARVRPGLCLNCDYNLTGNESGVCPECGTAIKATE